MKHISEILPEVLEHMTRDNIKSKAAEYADLYINNGNYAEAYKNDCKDNVFTPQEALAVVRIADVYVSVKNGRYTRNQGAEKQKEILKQLLNGNIRETIC